jgi:hypothetical protein
MTTLPPSSDFTGAGITEGQFKTAITSQRTFISELLGTSSTDKVAALSALGAILNDSLTKTGAYTLVAADKGKVIDCSGTWSLSLTAAATLGDGFAFAVWNNGAGTITIDPSGSETIDGATTKALAAGKLAICYSDGVKFITVGSIATGAGSGLDADLLDGQHGSYYATDTALAGKVSTDINASLGLGSIHLGSNGSGSNKANLATWAGGSTAHNCGATVSGTWRNITGGIVLDGSSAVLQRIA